MNDRQIAIAALWMWFAAIIILSVLVAATGCQHADDHQFLIEPATVPSWTIDWRPQ